MPITKAVRNQFDDRVGRRKPTNFSIEYFPNEKSCEINP